MKIEVTYDDIRDGVVGDPDRCPVSRALTRSIGVNCWVGLRSNMKFSYGPKYDLLNSKKLPENVSELIWEYDHGRGMIPFSFDLDINTEA